MIISRYLNKEIINTLLAVTFVLLLIFLSNQLVRYLSYAASGKLGSNILWHLMGLEIPYLLALILPLGLYLGIILTYGRLYADSELHVLQACGLSGGRLILITSFMVGAITVLVFVLTLWVNPWLSGEKDGLIKRSITEDNLLETLMPGRFQVSTDGKRVLYVERISRNHRVADNIFIADLKSADGWTVLSAQHGSQMKDPETQDKFIVAHGGNRYEGIPGQMDYKIIQFNKYAVRLPHTVLNTKRQEQESLPTPVLWEKYQNPDSAAELQWRFSIPLTALLLGMLAVPLSHVRPRYGRYSRLLPALLIYIIYINLLFISRSWIEQKFIPIGIGMWWVHVIIACLVLVFVLRQARWNLKYLARRFA